MLIGALAAVASAAPTAEKRGSLDLNAFNNFSFKNQDLQYINAVNSFDLQAFANLAFVQNLDISGFQVLFVEDVFDIQAILQLQQLALLAQLGSAGAFGSFDLSSLQIGVFNLGLLGNIGSFDISSIVDQSSKPQIQTIIQTTEITTVVIQQ